MANPKYNIKIKELGKPFWKIRADNKKELLQELKDLKLKL